LLEFEDLLCDLAPGQVFPFIHWLWGRAHDICAPTGTSSIHSPWSTSAYPHDCRAAFASWTIPPCPVPAVKHISLLRLATESTGVVTTFLVFVWRSFRNRTVRRVVLGDLANQKHDCWPALPFPFWAGLFMTVFAAWHSHLTPVPIDDGSNVHSTAFLSERMAVLVTADCP
jgi:hypothetical protein